MCQCKYGKQPENSNLCGAYAMAYWINERENTKCSDEYIGSLYKKFKFDEDDFEDQEVYSDVEEYCNPAKMMQWLMEEKKVKCSFKLGNNSEMVCMIFNSLKDLGPIKKLVSGGRFYLDVSEDGHLGLEIVDNRTGGLHYLYVYRDDEGIKAIDPFDGCVYYRDQLMENRYRETGAGIIIN